MKKIVILAVFIFWVAVSIFYANNLINPDTNNNSGNHQNGLQNGSGGQTQKEATSYGLELASHNTASDCWLLIDGKIYDVTSYINFHPGGANEILKYCGQDGTEAFQTKDKIFAQDHSANAYQMLADYYIGDMYQAMTNDSTSSNNQADNTQNNTTQNPAPVSYTLTKELVAQHNTASDCWVTGNNDVFNVTSYINSHPGGASNITRYCGQDIQAAFDSQGHSGNASQIFASMKIGTLGSTVSADTATNVVPPVSNTGREHDDDDDDEWDDD